MKITMCEFLLIPIIVMILQLLGAIMGGIMNSIYGMISTFLIGVIFASDLERSE